MLDAFPCSMAGRNIIDPANKGRSGVPSKVPIYGCTL